MRPPLDGSTRVPLATASPLACLSCLSTQVCGSLSLAQACFSTPSFLFILFYYYFFGSRSFLGLSVCWETLDMFCAFNQNCLGSFWGIAKCQRSFRIQPKILGWISTQVSQWHSVVGEYNLNIAMCNVTRYKVTIHPDHRLKGPDCNLCVLLSCPSMTIPHRISKYGG